MKVIIVGAGAAGVIAAINYKRNNLNDDVLIIEHLDKPLKKILATGNGKCNLGNDNIDFSAYSNPEFAEKVLKNYKYQELFDSLLIKTKTFGSLAYPISESAVSVREAMLNEVKKLNISIQNEEDLIDYKVDKQITVKTNKSKYIVDKLILAGGLKSSPKLGSDGSIFEILKKHNYKYREIEPGLSPLFTLEKTKMLDGVRCKCLVKLFSDNKLIHEESGEVLFKNHGLSGIVIFNIMSIISRDKTHKYIISLDLLPEFEKDYLNEYILKHNIDSFLLAFINPKVSAYLKTIYNKNNDILNGVKALEFTFDKSYGFDFSQVSVGGILPSQLQDNLESKFEKNVFIIGELIDVDGPCGGYNLTWAFASALHATK